MEIRRAVRTDAPAVLDLVEALARFEKLEPPDPAARARLIEDAFGDAPRLELWVADVDGAVRAYAAVVWTYSSFLARPTLYLEDIFVHPDARRRGVARALIERLRALAVERGCGRMEWIVLRWNRDALALYDSIGADRLDDDWVFMRKTL
jgi:GNAT superfamily N-acetyltransferase